MQAAAQAGVDRTTVMTLRKVAKDGAIAPLQAAVPGRRRSVAEESDVNSLRADPIAGHDGGAVFDIVVVSGGGWLRPRLRCHAGGLHAMNRVAMRVAAVRDETSQWRPCATAACSAGGNAGPAGEA